VVLQVIFSPSFDFNKKATEKIIKKAGATRQKEQ